jgi:cytochrome c peroxidase
LRLGQELFFDKRLSVDASRACSSCHANQAGGGGREPTSTGAKRKKLARHSPSLWNVGYLSALDWDGGFDSLETQALSMWAGDEMGVGTENLAAKAKQLAGLPRYKRQFEEVFPGQGVTPETIVEAIAAFERTLVCNETAYDKFARGDKNALSGLQKTGLELFMGKAACVICHTPPHFSSAYSSKTGAFFNTGVGVRGKAEAAVDRGRMEVSKNAADWAAFKPPSLRNVSKSAPYFHDGSERTLEGAVRFMANGGSKNKNLSSLLQDKQLSNAEIAALVAFLGALDCPGSIPEPKPR